MQVSVENISNIEKKMSISIEKKLLNQKIDKKIKQIASKSKIPGFRPGKAPLNIIKQRYASNINMESIEELINETMQKALEEQNFTPVSNPDIEISSKDSDNTFNYIATFEIYPEINIQDFKNLTIEDIQGEINDDDVIKMIESLRKQHTHYHLSDKKIAELNDKVTINFTGKLNGIEFEGGKAENHPLILGSETMIPGFEKEIIGKNINEPFSFKITFPGDYQAENLRGKETEFDVLINKIEIPHIPKLNKEFWKIFGVESDNIEDFQKEVRNNMQKELNRAKKILTKKNVLEALSKANEVQVPKKLITFEIKDMKKQMAEKYKMDNETASRIPDDMFQEQAEEKVKLRLLVAKIISNEQITAKKEEVESVLNEMAENYQDPEQLIKYYKGSQTLYKNLENITLENKLIELLLSKVQKTFKTLSYKEIVQEAYK